MNEPVISVAMIEAKARAAYERGDPLHDCLLPRDSAAWKTYKSAYLQIALSAMRDIVGENETA